MLSLFWKSAVAVALGLSVAGGAQAVGGHGHGGHSGHGGHHSSHHGGHAGHQGHNGQHASHPGSHRGHAGHHRTPYNGRYRFYHGRHHRHWSQRVWSAKYGTYLYWDPGYRVYYY